MRPRFDPERALGWDAIGLDGLSCFLRCVEAVLQARGCSRADIARALVGPIDLLRSRSTDFAFRGCQITWRKVADGREHWDDIMALLHDGEPLILMPDRYFWPHDELHLTHHFQDHMVLAIDCDRETLIVLDTDAPPSDGFERVMPVTDEVRRACIRYGVVVSRTPEPLSMGVLTTEVLVPSTLWLARDMATLHRFEETWATDELDDITARALHVVVLGTFQPTLFLLATCLRSFERAELTPVAAAAHRSARRAKRVGVLLLAMHAQHTSRMQTLCRKAFGQLLDDLKALLDEIRTVTPESHSYETPPPAHEAELFRFHDRLASVAESCFGTPRPAATR